jgi:hypothetical protein
VAAEELSDAGAGAPVGELAARLPALGLLLGAAPAILGALGYLAARHLSRSRAARMLAATAAIELTLGAAVFALTDPVKAEGAWALWIGGLCGLVLAPLIAIWGLMRAGEARRYLHPRFRHARTGRIVAGAGMLMSAAVARDILAGVLGAPALLTTLVTAALAAAGIAVARRGSRSPAPTRHACG